MDQLPFFVTQHRLEAITKAFHEEGYGPMKLKKAAANQISWAICNVMFEAAEGFRE
ncbi:MAG: hypothetical protein AAF485_20095 [Chloroflexota bacterium]